MSTTIATTTPTKTRLPSWETTSTPEDLSFTEIEELIRQAGGSAYEAEVGAGISKGVESGGQTQVLAGGIGPAQGLWQFEPTTWAEYAPEGAPPTASGASPIQQAEAFVNDVGANKGFASWAPDLGYTYGENPQRPASGSPVAQYLGSGVGDPAELSSDLIGSSVFPSTAQLSNTLAHSGNSTNKTSSIKLGTFAGSGLTLNKSLMIRAALGIFGAILLLIALKELTNSSHGAVDTVVTVPQQAWGSTKRNAGGWIKKARPSTKPSTTKKVEKGAEHTAEAGAAAASA